jgi:hypothetical protein
MKNTGNGKLGLDFWETLGALRSPWPSGPLGKVILNSTELAGLPVRLPQLNDKINLQSVRLPPSAWPVAFLDV